MFGISKYLGNVCLRIIWDSIAEILDRSLIAHLLIELTYCKEEAITMA